MQPGGFDRFGGTVTDGTRNSSRLESWNSISPGGNDAGDKVTRTAAKGRSSYTPFEMPGDGFPTRANPTFDDLSAAMSGSTARAGRAVEANTAQTKAGRATTVFELPGDGSPQPYNATFEDLRGAMSSSRSGKVSASEAAVEARAKGSRSASTAFEIPGDGVPRANESIDDLRAAMAGKPDRARGASRDGSRVTVSRLAPRHQAFEIPGDGFSRGPESILP